MISRYSSTLAVARESRPPPHDSSNREFSFGVGLISVGPLTAEKMAFLYVYEKNNFINF